jgi:hypothetical protein
MVWGGSVAFVRFCAVCGPLAAIQSQVGRPPFLADGFCPLRTSNGSRPARTRPAEASAGPLADTLRPICPGLGRRAGLPARRPRLAALKRWRAGLFFLRPRGGGGSSAIAGSFGGVVGRSARLRAFNLPCERSEPLIRGWGSFGSICPGARGARPGASAPGLNHSVSAANHLLRRLQPARGYAGRGAPKARAEGRLRPAGAGRGLPLRGGAALCRKDVKDFIS